MIEFKYIVRKTDVFETWVKKLRDRQATTHIYDRIVRIYQGNFGDHKYLGGGISELKIHYGPGYRLYYTERNGLIVVLLAGGDKSTQERDIVKAKQLAKEWKE